MKMLDGCLKPKQVWNPCRTMLAFCQYYVNREDTDGHTLRLCFTLQLRKHGAKFGKRGLKTKITQEQMLAILNKIKQLNKPEY